MERAQWKNKTRRGSRRTSDLPIFLFKWEGNVINAESVPTNKTPEYLRYFMLYVMLCFRNLNLVSACDLKLVATHVLEIHREKADFVYAIQVRASCDIHHVIAPDC